MIVIVNTMTTLIHIIYLLVVFALCYLFVSFGSFCLFLISETKIDNSFPDAQFSCKGYSKAHRKDRTLGGGGLLVYVNENIPSRLLKEQVIPNDAEIMCRDKSKETKMDYFWCILSPKSE